MALNISSVLEKMANRDKDFRYMATSDLCTELQKDNFKIDPDNEKRICGMLLKLLEDSSGDVQGLAVKCLGFFIKKAHQNQIQEITDKLADHLLKDKKPDLKDISSTGLKKVIAEVSTKDGSLVVSRLTNRIIQSLSADESADMKLECLEILNDLIARFGSLISDHGPVLDAITPQLTSTRTAARKRAINCLGHLSVSIPDKLFNQMVTYLVQHSEKSTKAEHIRTFIQALGAISRSVGFRLGKFLSQVVPLVGKYCNDSRFEDDDELKENCFHTFESLVLRCPKEVTPFIKQITDLSLQFIKYDPNYNDEDGDEMEVDEEEEEPSTDDDDMSWKVRRAATRAISAIITTRPELLPEFYKNIAPILIARFKDEREENVKLEIFSTFKDLLRQTNATSRKLGPSDDPSSPPNLLRSITPQLTAAVSKHLKGKSTHIRTAAFSLLKDVALTVEGILEEHIAVIIPGVEASLTEKNVNSIRIETLAFLRLLLSTHPGKALHPHIKTLTPLVVKAVNDNSHKIIAGGLRTCYEIVKIIRPNGQTTNFDYKPYVSEIFNCVKNRLKALDADQEVKDGAITCTGLLLANLGDELKNEIPDCLKILLERLGNEITRLVTIKALACIAASSLNVDLSPILTETVNQLSSFLRQNNRQLKQSSLTTLDVLVKNYGKNKALAGLFTSLLSQLAPLINGEDIHLSHLALNLTVDVLRVHPESAAQVKEKMFSQILELAQSSLLQGLALESLLSLFKELVVINTKGFGFDQLLESLLGLTHKSLPKQCYSSIAQCVASVCVNAQPAQRDPTVSRFINDIKKGKDDSSKLLALLCIGEIGRRTDLSSHESIQNVILTVFDSTSDETMLPSAASFALGNVAVGNLSKFLPFILKDISQHPKREYLLLHSLREIISRHSATSALVKDLHPHMKQILDLLFFHCQSTAEGTRNVVAECLGKLSLINPQELIPKLVELKKSGVVSTRGTIITALKFTIVEQPHPIDKLLHPVMGEFLTLLKDEDLNVRRAALLTLTYSAHNKPALIRNLLGDILPLVYSETKIKPELQREVQLGPFAYKVDDGLDLRKSAFDCMYNLLETCLDRLEVPTFITHLSDGLKDVYDIKMISHMMLTRLAKHSPGAVVEALDNLIDPLRATINTKPKDTAVKQEIDKNEDMIRSALRAVAAISRIPNVDQNIKFDDFLKTIKSGDLNEKFEAANVSDAGDQMDLE